jgi:transcriptional regulator with XRE-family HTH domain
MPAPEEQLRAFGRTVRALRRERELSQEALAGCAGVHVNQVGRLERGRGDVYATTLLAIAGGLDMPLSEIVVAYEARLRDGR